MEFEVPGLVTVDQVSETKPLIGAVRLLHVAAVNNINTESNLALSVK